MQLTSNDFKFQGYTVAKEKPTWTVWQLKKWEREADYQSYIEYMKLDGEDNDFLEVYPMPVIIFHKERAKK
jgi:hypothetical protein